jgi:alkylation response protein AidB-like acyl-CoA dehydrogenase
MVTLAPEETRAIRALVSDFAHGEVAPLVAEYDREEKMPRDLLERAAELGLFGARSRLNSAGSGWTMSPLPRSSRS